VAGTTHDEPMSITAEVLHGLVEKYLAEYPDEWSRLARLSLALTTRGEPSGHVTSAVVLIDPRWRVLYLHHPGRQRWLLPEAHLTDADDSLPDAALRELYGRFGIEPDTVAPLPGFEVLRRQKIPAPCSRHARRNGLTESLPMYALTVITSASGGSPPRGSTNAAAYASAVDGMSPRFTSATTRRPAARACSQMRSKTATPRDPSASKKADWSFTATAVSETASTIPRQKRS